MKSKSPKPYLRDLSKRIRDARDDLHISQEEVAYRSAISPTQYGRIERGESMPTVKTLSHIEEALQLQPGSLLHYLFPPMQDGEKKLAEFNYPLGKEDFANIMEGKTINIVISLQRNDPKRE